jgi:digeranylgeranylglycerophospholipid reductase
VGKAVNYDAVIVGGGTAGAYLGWLLAQKGFSVAILEKQKQGEPGSRIGIFHIDEIRFAQFELPLPSGEELIGYHPDGLAWPPDGDGAKQVDYAFYVMEMPLFIKRLQGYAVAAGAEILFQTEFTNILLEGERPAGVLARRGAEELTLHAPLVVDASGVDGVVRTRLPAGVGVEREPIDAQDFLYVILQYWDDIRGDFPRGLNFYPYHKAFINPGYGEGMIVGIGQPGKLETARQVQEQFLAERFPDVKYRLVRKTWGRTPYRRSPYSLVADSFMVLGDAAFMTKPFSGEGVTSGFTACRIAAAVAAEALTAGDSSREQLWELNVRYFRDQGAKFAELFAQLGVTAVLAREDVNYLFKRDVIFSGGDLEQMNRFFEVKMNLGKLLKTGAALAAGRMSGRLSREGFGALLSAMSRASKIRKHYEKYPAKPSEFPAWETRARALWGEEG